MGAPSPPCSGWRLRYRSCWQCRALAMSRNRRPCSGTRRSQQFNNHIDSFQNREAGLILVTQLRARAQWPGWEDCPGRTAGVAGIERSPKGTWNAVCPGPWAPELPRYRCFPPKLLCASAREGRALSLVDHGDSLGHSLPCALAGDEHEMSFSMSAGREQVSSC